MCAPNRVLISVEELRSRDYTGPSSSLSELPRTFRTPLPKDFEVFPGAGEFPPQPIRRSTSTGARVKFTGTRFRICIRSDLRIRCRASHRSDKGSMTSSAHSVNTLKPRFLGITHKHQQSQCPSSPPSVRPSTRFSICFTPDCPSTPPL